MSEEISHRIKNKRELSEEIRRLEVKEQEYNVSLNIKLGKSPFINPDGPHQRDLASFRDADRFIHLEDVFASTMGTSNPIQAAESGMTPLIPDTPGIQELPPDMEEMSISLDSRDEEEHQRQSQCPGNGQPEYNSPVSLFRSRDDEDDEPEAVRVTDEPVMQGSLHRSSDMRSQYSDEHCDGQNEISHRSQCQSEEIPQADMDGSHCQEHTESFHEEESVQGKQKCPECERQQEEEEPLPELDIQRQYSTDIQMQPHSSVSSSVHSQSIHSQSIHSQPDHSQSVHSQSMHSRSVSHHEGQEPKSSTQSIQRGTSSDVHEPADDPTEPVPVAVGPLISDFEGDDSVVSIVEDGAANISQRPQPSYHSMHSVQEEDRPQAQPQQSFQRSRAEASISHRSQRSQRLPEDSIHENAETSRRSERSYRGESSNYEGRHYDAPSPDVRFDEPIANASTSHQCSEHPSRRSVSIHYAAPSHYEGNDDEHDPWEDLGPEKRSICSHFVPTSPALRRMAIAKPDDLRRELEELRHMEAEITEASPIHTSRPNDFEQTWETVERDQSVCTEEAIKSIAKSYQSIRTLRVSVVAESSASMEYNSQSHDGQGETTPREGDVLPDGERITWSTRPPSPPAPEERSCASP